MKHLSWLAIFTHVIFTALVYSQAPNQMTKLGDVYNFETGISNLMIENNSPRTGFHFSYSPVEYASDKPMGLLPFNHRNHNITIGASNYYHDNQYIFFNLSGRFVSWSGLDIQADYLNNRYSGDYLSESLRFAAGQYFHNFFILTDYTNINDRTEYSYMSNLYAYYYFYPYHSLSFN